MASSRALGYQILRQKRFLYNLSSTSLCCIKTPIINSQAFYSNNQNSMPIKSEQSNSKNQIQTGFADVVKENTKSAWYLSVIVGGIGITACIFYTILKELFSESSPNGIYKKAVKRCLQDSRVLDALGEPVKAYGEESRRGRRNHVRHNIFIQNGVKHIRMQFYVQGIRKRGTVNLEVKETKSGDFEYNYLIIKLEDMLRSTIILEDGRNSVKNTTSSDELPSPLF
ncbi:mitochondrial import inner membrane translocase subunit Tim21 [Leptopilina boulardi]|uniref:mitochondrial import inner membrane translocase subunit Tim21 n=1 Tax=Leptopilina boulardi TaxID=63433 RepID=UPI0021F603FD|nr:mitochondrial import inner membrane translocase subunit Tim21 [Leptopilina boulardi]